MGRLWVFIVCFVLLTPTTAVAHAYLVKSAPARRAVLFKAPARLQLWFNERLEPRFSSVTITDSSGNRVDRGDLQVSADDPKQLSIGINAVVPGSYTVEFRVLSVDGHTVKDQFPFTIRVRQ